ncbi:hypothetical protein [Bradyrhizobium sp. CCBAU 11386]|uniref:hypothetical protein n=1 Tax=Bradyrhizobium sp. CCBAU 11386 TaxID=1630837 RepID=UPI002302A049|nr:hypothetical protein [Bradyrhizobium sp. CCBAU 11386]
MENVRQAVLAMLPKFFLRPATPASFAEKLALSVLLFVVSIFWGVVRSSLILRSAFGDVLENEVPFWIRISFFAALVIPSAVFFLLRRDRFWLLGLSSAIGVLPELPLLPFMRDYAHLVIIGSVTSALLFGRTFRPESRIPGFARAYVLYVLLCGASAIVNFVLFQNIWQLKVGISFLLFFTALAAMIATVSSRSEPPWRIVEGVVDGFVWGAIGQCLIAIVSLPLLFIVPYEQGNDTVFGLAYYDRYKSTMSGPVSLGVFFVAAMPLVLLWMRRRSSPANTRLGWMYLQMAPWLIVFSGSRTARVVVIGLILSFLLKPATRRAALLILPSTAIAFYVGFYFESFPSAVRALLGDTNAATLSIRGRFFEVSDRSELIIATLRALPLLGQTLIELARSNGGPFDLPPVAAMLPPQVLQIINLIVGYGAGVGGYLRSGYPSPHTTLLNLLVETGILGFVLYCAFITWLALRLLVRSFSGSDPHAITPWLCLLSYGAVLTAHGTYVPQWWGYYSVILILAAAAAGNSTTGQRPGELSTCALSQKFTKNSQFSQLRDGGRRAN